MSWALFIVFSNHVFYSQNAKRDNAGLQRRGANSSKLGRRKHHEEEAIAASAASLC